MSGRRRILNYITTTGERDCLRRGVFLFYERIVGAVISVLGGRICRYVHSSVFLIAPGSEEDRVKKKKQQCRVLCSSGGVVPCQCACNAGKWGKSTQLKFTCAKRVENKNNISINNNKGKFATRITESELKMKWVIFLICTGKYFCYFFSSHS